MYVEQTRDFLPTNYSHFFIGRHIYVTYKRQKVTLKWNKKRKPDKKETQQNQTVLTVLSNIFKF